jgi:cell division protein FtsB
MKTQEKELLLSEVNEVLIDRDENVNLSLAIAITSGIMVILFLFIPKVYLSNNIYKNSIQINQLNKEYLSLKNENKILKAKIAVLKYKNGVTH